MSEPKTLLLDWTQHMYNVFAIGRYHSRSRFAVRRQTRHCELAEWRCGSVCSQGRPKIFKPQHDAHQRYEKDGQQYQLATLAFAHQTPASRSGTRRYELFVSD